MEIHVVQPGESLYRIAAHYGVPPAALLRENERADPNRLTPGECLLVPEKGRTHTVRRGETLASVAQQEGTDERTLLRRAIEEGADTVTDAGNAVIMARF